MEGPDRFSHMLCHLTEKLNFKAEKLLKHMEQKENNMIQKNWPQQSTPT